MRTTSQTGGFFYGREVKAAMTERIQYFKLEKPDPCASPDGVGVPDIVINEDAWIRAYENIAAEAWRKADANLISI